MVLIEMTKPNGCGNITRIVTSEGVFQRFGGRYANLGYKPALEIFDKELIEKLNEITRKSKA